MVLMSNRPRNSFTEITMPKMVLYMSAEVPEYLQQCTGPHLQFHSSITQLPEQAGRRYSDILTIDVKEHSPGEHGSEVWAGVFFCAM